MSRKKIASTRHEQNLALKLLEIVPPLMALVRDDLQISAEDRLSLAQFRILANIRRGVRHVSQIAEQQGVSQPAMSKMVEQMASRGLLKRVAHEEDRRHITLAVTSKGEILYESVRTQAERRLIGRLKGFSAKRLSGLVSALGALEEAFLETPAAGKVQK